MYGFKSEIRDLKFGSLAGCLGVMVVTRSHLHCPISNPNHPTISKIPPNQGLGYQDPFGGNKADRREPQGAIPPKGSW